ncbi:MAG TPA: hypothetical protein VMM16_13695 [Verrucomicrobiae bacterium]|nr:hypothetical protein [Verrucomicrobiae bacterium]
MTKRRRAMAIFGGCLAAVAAAAALAKSPAKPPATPAGSMFITDRGNFRILVGGQQVGKEEFEINPNGDNWVAHGSSDVQTADGVTHVSGTLQLRSDGLPLKYEWATQGKKKASATIDFSNLTATIELHLEGAKPYTQQFTFNTSPITVLDNNLYHQYAVVARLYDRQKKGPQTFSVLVPQSLTPGTITVDSLGDQNVDGKKLEELTVKTEDLEVDLFLDGTGRLIRLAAPSSNAEIVRE